MNFTITLNPMLLTNKELTISNLVDAIRNDKTRPIHAINVSYLDHANNTVVIYSSPELSTFLQNYFSHQIKIGAIKIEELTHHSGHKTFLDKDGNMKCGCGWVETDREKQERELA